MTAYYNEHDPKKAAWLRALIARDLIAPGDVDERSIRDVQGADLDGYTQCHFFAGIGVWSAALRNAGWADTRPVWTGSCPCQPFSVAGDERGVADDRHLWPAWFRLIRECRPDTIFGEQVASAIRHGWLDGVSADVEGEGYALGHTVFGAHSVGAPHIRQRLYFVADFVGNADSTRPLRYGRPLKERVPEEREGAARLGAQASMASGFWADCDWLPCRDGKTRAVRPGTFPLVDGSAARVVRLRGYGDGIVLQAAQAFIEAYAEVVA